MLNQGYSAAAVRTGTLTSLLPANFGQGISRSAIFVVFGLVVLATIAILLRGSGGIRNREYIPVYSFGIEDGSEIAGPLKLVMGTDRALYGTISFRTESVFRFDPGDAKIHILHRISRSPESLVGINSGLISVQGFLFGTTAAGGSADRGTVFKLREDGTGFAILYSFGVEPSGGTSPTGTLVQGRDGALYGTSC